MVRADVVAPRYRLILLILPAIDGSSVFVPDAGIFRYILSCDDIYLFLVVRDAIVMHILVVELHVVDVFIFRVASYDELVLAVVIH